MSIRVRSPHSRPSTARNAAMPCELSNARDASTAADTLPRATATAPVRRRAIEGRHNRCKRGASGRVHHSAAPKTQQQHAHSARRQRAGRVWWLRVCRPRIHGCAWWQLWWMCWKGWRGDGKPGDDWNKARLRQGRHGRGRPGRTRRPEWEGGLLKR
eukprot:364258-Chlamydomonas_euryale.AAC.4